MAAPAVTAMGLAIIIIMAIDTANLDIIMVVEVLAIIMATATMDFLMEALEETDNGAMVGTGEAHPNLEPVAETWVEDLVDH